MSVFLQSVPADVWHVTGALLLVLDAQLVTLLAVYWREVGPPGRPAQRRLKGR